MDVSISIVSYNTVHLLKRCVQSIYKHTKGITFEVIVVDNDSFDNSSSMIKNLFPQVKIITNKENLYFTKANNQALKRAKGRYFLILNADTFFIDNSLRKMVHYLDNNLGIGACEGLEIYENGKIVNTGSKHASVLLDFFELSLIGTRIASQEMIRNFRLKSKDRKKTFEIDVGCDAFLMVRKKVMDTVRGYDEKFLLYYTENDLCLRIQALGYRIMHFGEAKVVHRVSASVSTLGWKKTDIYYQDLFYYYKKNGYFFWGALLFILLKCEEYFLKIIK